MFPRIFHSGPLGEGVEVRLTGGAAAHLGKVLRLRENDELVVFNGDGLDHMARILLVSRHDVTVEVGAGRETQTESPISVMLLQGICRNQRMDLLIQKSTELGIRSIQPLICERSVAKMDRNRADRKVEHWRGVAISACEQCGRARIPAVEPPVRLAEVFEALDAATAKLMLDPEGSDTVAEAVGSSHSVALLVGPEGGLTRAERELATAAGFRRVRLGPRTLRTETAPIVALSIIQYLSGDLAGP
jgi:16S rRNA (uracil1498-N3)-methyltransferase